ncbi:glycosyltransferase [Pseudonocardia aurantiaca]|uniref:Glycosyltransferase n=1 Tax=Pseudonocardia aurantiaca TaxID=75290 RepID=A0ABW4FVI1_9PSEU
MTRIFLATMPVTTHVRPALPIARELVEKGHEVLWRCGRNFEEEISRTGASFAPVARHLDFDENSAVLATLDERRPGVPGFKKVVLRVFIESVPGHVDDIAPMLDAFRPDILFSDYSLLATPILANQRGVRTVLFVGGPLPLAGAGAPPPGSGLLPTTSPLGRFRDRSLCWLVTHVLFRDVQRALRRSLAGLGAPKVDTFFMNWPVQLADRYLVMTVPEFEYPRGDLPPVVEFVGPALPDRPASWVPPPWWPEVERARAVGTPVVLVTPGGAPTANPATLLHPTVTALADEDVLVVAETGNLAPDDVLPADRRPANLRLERSVPPTELLPMTDLMVTNGGYDSVQLSLAHGVPLVVTGVSDNRLEANNRVRWSGAGVFLKTWRPEPARLNAAVTEVLREPRYRTAAGRLRDSYARHPGARRAAEVILEVAGATTP